MAAYVWIRDKKCVLRRVSECGAGREGGRVGDSKNCVCCVCI